jgi:hypothetical protein
MVRLKEPIAALDKKPVLVLPAFVAFGLLLPPDGQHIVRKRHFDVPLLDARKLRGDVFSLGDVDIRLRHAITGPVKTGQWRTTGKIVEGVLDFAQQRPKPALIATEHGWKILTCHVWPPAFGFSGCAIPLAGTPLAVTLDAQPRQMRRHLRRLPGTRHSVPWQSSKQGGVRQACLGAQFPCERNPARAIWFQRCGTADFCGKG